MTTGGAVKRRTKTHMTVRKTTTARKTAPKRKTVTKRRPAARKPAGKRKPAARKPAARKPAGKRKSPAKRKTTSKYSEMTSDQLRKLISRHNKKHPQSKIKTTVKVKKGSQTVTRPKKKSALVAAARKHRL